MSGNLASGRAARQSRRAPGPGSPPGAGSPGDGRNRARDRDVQRVTSRRRSRHSLVKRMAPGPDKSVPRGCVAHMPCFLHAVPDCWRAPRGTEATVTGAVHPTDPPSMTPSPSPEEFFWAPAHGHRPAGMMAGWLRALGGEERGRSPEPR